MKLNDFEHAYNDKVTLGRVKGVRRWFLLALSVACVWLLQGCGGGGGGGPVVSAILLLSTNVLDFQETLSQLTLEVRNGGSATLSWIASPSAPWIQLSVVSGNLAPGQGSIVQVTIDRNQLVPGLNLGNIAVRSNGGNANVTVRATRASDPPPPPPSSLSASQGDFTDSVLIVWSGVTGATGYKVERAESSGGPFTLLATATTENYSDLTATPGKDYWYRVSAVRGTETSVPAGPVNGWRKPVAPENVIASDGSFLDRIQVDWLPVLGASAYRVERATNSAGPFESLTDTHNLPPYFDLTAEPGIYYYYRVSAFVMNHYGQESTVDVGYRGEVPGLLPPENVTASDGTFPNRIGISWFPSPGATYYKVFRADSAGGVLITLADHVTSTSYEDNTVTPGRLYYYRIQAWNDSGASALSAMDSGYAGLEIPAPSGLSASDGLYSDKVRVSWDPVPGATLYLIQRSESATGPFADLSSVSGTTYDDTTATPGIDYFYKVRAFVGSTGGLFGDPDAGWRMPATPADVNASDGTRLDVVEIHWTPVPGAGSYIVERSLSRNADYTEIATTSIASYEDSTAEIAVTYWYRVRTMMHSHNSPASLPDSGYRGIEPPLNFQASDGLSTDGVLLSWEGPDDANFEVQRGPAPLGPFSEVLGVTPVGVKNFTDTTASHGEDYAYRVIARKNFIDSEPSLPDTGWRKPVAPSNLTASDGSSTTGIDLSWDPPSHPATFSVLRAEASGGPFSEIAQGITETTYTDVDAESGKTYFYRVRSVFGSHTSDDSNEDAGYRSLSPPSNVQASDGAYSDRIRVSWDPAPFASGYDVYRSEQPLTGFVKVNMNPVSGITYDDAETSLNISVDYYYQVVSLRGTYSSAPSVTDSGWRAPETPTGVTASDGSFTDRIEVSWNAVPGVDSYKVFRATLSSGPYSEIASGITGTTYIDFSASADIIYYYRVRATQNGRDSADSSIDAGFHGAPYPPNLSASDGTFSDKVRISWDPVPQADSYNLYRADNPLGPYSPLTLNLTVTVNDDTSAQVATDYWYRVTSVRYGVESVQSPEDAGWRAPQAPTGVSASDGTYSDRVRITWNAVSGANEYKVYRSGSEGGSYSYLATVTAPTTQYDDTSVTQGTTYWYKVSTVINAHEGPQSSADSGYAAENDPTANTPWPRWRARRDLQGRSTQSGPTASNPPTATFATDSPIKGSPAIDANGRVLIGSFDFKLYSLTPTSTGLTLNWEFFTGDYVSSTAVVDTNGDIYFGSQNGTFYKLSNTGATVWTFSAGGAIESSANLTTANAIFGSDDGKVYAVGRATGAQSWVYNIGGNIKSSPAYHNGKVYVGSTNGLLVALNASDGSLVWSQSLGTALYASPVVDPVNGRLYIGGDNGTFYARNLSDGGAVWSYTPASPDNAPIVASAALDASGNIYFGNQAGKLYKLNSSGILQSGFPFTADDSIESSPAIDSSGNIYFGSWDRSIYAITSSGTLLWKKVTGDSITWSSPAIGVYSGVPRIYIGSYDLKVWVVRNS